MLDDVRNEFVSEQAARDEYGVVVDTTVWQVDVAATERWRTKMHEARGDIAPDDVKWE